MGSEMCIRDRQGHSQKENAKEFSYSPTTLLKSDAVANLLKLTDNQKEEIRDLLESSTEKIKTSETMKKLKADLVRHWRALLGCMDAEQSERVLKLIGEPVWWFRNGGSKKFKNRDSSSSGEVVMSGKVNLVNESGSSVYQMSPDELRAQGVSFIHSHVFEMSQDRFIHEGNRSRVELMQR